jgi:Fic family protein
MKQLTLRQNQIYNFICAQGAASNGEITAYLTDAAEKVSRITVVRDIETLLKNKYIKRIGAGRSVKYKEYNNNTLLRYYDADAYFKTEADQRVCRETFNFAIFRQFGKIFADRELRQLNLLTEEYRRNLARIKPDRYRREIERLTIELSWKSSQIEGNTYSLLDTEELLKNHREAVGHERAEALMLLNHKTALDYIFAHKIDYRNITLRKIEDVHRLLVKNLAVSHGIRNSLVSIIGTKYLPLDNRQQISEAVESTVRVINKYADPFHKSLAAIVLLSYIQPFADGNKRAARIIGNALLAARQACPLSYRNIEPVEYKKALLVFYEQNSLSYFKELYLTQYAFSVKNYFLSKNR